MKKLLIAAFLIVSVSVSGLAQNVNKVDKRAIGNFEVMYAGASSVQWTSKENFTKASFTQNDQHVDVFYNENGDFIATATQIRYDELPASLKKSIEKKYSNYSIREMLKYKAYDDTVYFISLENEKETIVLKGADGSLSVYSDK